MHSRPGVFSEVATVGGAGSGRLFHEVLDEGVLDAEHRVAIEQFVAAYEDVGDQCPLTLGGDHEMQVRRPHRRASCGVEHPPDGSVERDGVRSRGEAPERKLSVLVGEQVTAGGDPSVGVLDVVEAVVVGLPYFDPSVRNGVACDIGDGSLDPAGLARCAVGDVPARLDGGGVVDEERTEHRRLRLACDRFVVDGHGLHRGSENVGEQDEFLTSVIGDVTDLGEELDGRVPFVLRQPDLSDERVEMLGQSREQFSQSRIGGVGETGDDLVGQCPLPAALLGGDVGATVDTHVSVPRSRKSFRPRRYGAVP